MNAEVNEVPKKDECPCRMILDSEGSHYQNEPLAVDPEHYVIFNHRETREPMVAISKQVWNSKRIREVTLKNLDLEDTPFRGFILNCVAFDNCYMRDCSFNGAHLIGVSFRKSTLRGTGFGNAFLADVDFRLADLAEVGLTGAAINSARGLVFCGTNDHGLMYGWKDPATGMLKVQAGCRMGFYHHFAESWEGQSGRARAYANLQYFRSVAVLRGWKIHSGDPDTQGEDSED